MLLKKFYQIFNEISKRYAMRSLEDIAIAYESNRPTIYARVKKLKTLHPNEQLTEKIDNTLYLTDLGYALLTQNLREKPLKGKRTSGQHEPPIQDESFQRNFNEDLKKNSKEFNENLKNEPKEQDVKDKLIEEQKAEIEFLRSQLITKDQQTKQLVEVMDNLNQTIKELNKTMRNTLFESHSLLLDKKSEEVKATSPEPIVTPPEEKIEETEFIVEETIQEPSPRSPKETKAPSPKKRGLMTRLGVAVKILSGKY